MLEINTVMWILVQHITLKINMTLYGQQKQKTFAKVSCRKQHTFKHIFSSCAIKSISFFFFPLQNESKCLIKCNFCEMIFGWCISFIVCLWMSCSYMKNMLPLLQLHYNQWQKKNPCCMQKYSLSLNELQLCHNNYNA